jgi:hypothetical protein
MSGRVWNFDDRLPLAEDKPSHCSTVASLLHLRRWKGELPSMSGLRNFILNAPI